MHCPTDGSTLVMSERSGVEIDYCPQCRGVWLDRGELDKIVERMLNESVPNHRTSHGAPTAPAYPAQVAQPWGQSSYGTKKKSHWLTELFD
ncbi:MAG TPA: zf-TFIIB domain-containing protein [Microbacteriaceae bacterium]|nr:zf-TFIIB domain-containing protein [Microbacteriaceae bacterium]